MIRFFTVALVLTLVGAVCAQTDIRDAPGGKRLLFVDNDDIRPEPGGKRLLFVDGQDIRDEPGGKRLMFVDGDDVRPEPGSYRIALSKGYEFIRQQHRVTVRAGSNLHERYELGRWASMPKLGWYSSDDHVHLRRSPRENPLINRP